MNYNHLNYLLRAFKLILSMYFACVWMSQKSMSIAVALIPQLYNLTIQRLMKMKIISLGSSPASTTVILTMFVQLSVQIINLSHRVLLCERRRLVLNLFIILCVLNRRRYQNCIQKFQ